MFTSKGSPASYTPEGILTLLDKSPYFQKSRVLKESALFFITLLYFRTINSFDNGEDEKIDTNNNFQPISSDLIIAMISRKNYKAVLSELVKLNILEINDSYTTGVSNKKYKLNSELLSDKPRVRKFELDILKKKFYRLDDYFKTRIINEFPYTVPMLNNIRDRIFVDLEQAIEFINNADYSNKKKDIF